nr:copper amine oxidase N-terminal domain-containing protein [uncultured Niameybacter sp.]
MKKIFLSKWLLVFILSSICALPIFAKETPDLFLDGVSKNVDIILKDSNTLVPLRFCSEELKAVVNWDKSTQQITIEKGSTTLVFKLDSMNYIHNTENKNLLIAPTLINGVTYIPFRPLVEALNGVVVYNNEHKFINIYNPDSKAYKVYKTLNSQNVIEHRFAMLESPRIANIPDIDATSHYYIFPLENPNANYFLEYQGSWEDEPLVSLKYYSIVDGIAVNTWGRQVNQNESFSVNVHPLFKLIGDAPFKDKIEFGVWPNPSDLNYLMFYQDTTGPGVFYLNNIWTEWFLLDNSITGNVKTSPFFNKNLVLFDINNQPILNKYIK